MRYSAINLAEYVALRALGCFPAAASVPAGRALARLVGRLVDASNPRRQKRMEENISLAFPDWSPDRVKEVRRQSMEHLMQVVLVDAQIMHRVITEPTWPEHLFLQSAAPLLDRLMRREPMVVLTAHYGNWEMLGFALSALEYPIDAVIARPVGNKLIYDWILRIRQAYGTRIISQAGATPILTSLLEAGGRVGTTADQNAGDQGIFVPFFGRLASSYKAIALMAIRHNVPVVIGCARRCEGELCYELHAQDIIPPEDWADQDDPTYYVTARYTRAIEQMVRIAPEQYLWLHRRWKSRPRFEREGKPMPQKLINKIKSLPWMTDQELELIMERSRPTDEAQSHPPTQN